YHYRVRSSDQIGNVSYSNDETFTTDALAQVSGDTGSGGGGSGGGSISTPIATTTIIFSGIEAQSIGTSTITIAWHTDLPSDSRVEYGVSSALGSVSPIDAALVTSHALTLTGLQQNTNYIFRVVSRPAGAPVATVSGNHEFDTLAVPQFTSIPANVNNVT